MSFAITMTGRWQSGFRRRDWDPEAADMMCRERRQGTDRRFESATLEKISGRR